MTLKHSLLIFGLMLCLESEAKTFQNSYVAFEVPDNWSCLQEGVAWTCTPQNATEAKEAVIVLAAKVAGPEDSLPAFLNFLKQPKKITTKIGTPMPSEVMYAQNRTLAGHNWVQAQHLGSEIQDYYTLYLATVKDQLAILISFSAEKTRYQIYNAIFDKAIKSLKIVANNQLLFPKNNGLAGDPIGIQGPIGNLAKQEEVIPLNERKGLPKSLLLLGGIVALAVAAGAYIFSTRRKKNSHRKIPKSKAK